MIITPTVLDACFRGANLLYTNAFAGYESIWPTLAMRVQSTTEEETYGWMEQLPFLREWIGPRVIRGLKASGFTIRNRNFEQTVGVPRNKIEDDKFGLYGPFFSEMGRAAAEMPDKLVAELFLAGFTTNCYDGQYFFDSDHPVINADNTVTTSVSNVQAGSGDPWFLLDTTRAFKPIIYQERRSFGSLVAKNRPEDDNVFFNNEFIFGSDGRANVGYGLWQLAFGSKATLDATNYNSARTAMQSYVGEGGRKLGIRPTAIVTGPNNEEAARKLLKSQFITGGESNPWYESATLIISPWL